MILNILVTLDRRYLSPLKTMLGSMFFNNPGEVFDIYMVADGISEEEQGVLSSYCRFHGSQLHRILISEEMFANAPVIRYYSKAMYYRLLAAEFLPDTIDKILYLDPDILVINPLRPLYGTDISRYLFAAAMHSGLTGISGYVNKLRFPEEETDFYFNSGVLLMNLSRMRTDVREKEIFEFVEKYKDFLILPDQDVLNGLYNTRILPVDESYWNYDVRKYETYRLASQGRMDMDWVMEHTAILHFCGKNKPWDPKYRGRFSALYKHYRCLAERDIEIGTKAEKTTENNGKTEVETQEGLL